MNKSYGKKTPFYLQISGLTISTTAHGPALTLTYQKSGDHHISMDLVPVLFKNYTKVRINRSVWDRPFFVKNQRGQNLADMLQEEKILLVPKKPNAWLISYEHAAKKMLNGLDSSSTCRKMCHRILKYDLLKWNSKEAFEGMSTYPLKVLWDFLILRTKIP